MRAPLLLLALLALAAVPLTPARAAPPASLVIEADKPGGPFVGTFESSGAFADAGTIEVVDTTITGTQSERLLVNHLTYEFVGEAGTFLLATQNRVTFGTPVSTFHGHWRVAGGTGDYAGLRGQGSLEGTLDAAGVFHYLFAGQVQLA